MDDSYRTNTIIFIFNICDTLGRKFPQILTLPKSRLSLLVFLRMSFLFTFPLVGVLLGNTWISPNSLSILTILNMSLFAFSSGYITSTAFSLAPDQVPNELKGKSGSSISFFLIIGIFTGSLYATFVMQYLV
jgi:MFS family permease